MGRGGGVDWLNPQNCGDDSELYTSAIFFSAFWNCILCFLSKVKDNNTNKTNHMNNGGSNNPRFDWVVVVVVVMVMMISSSFQC